MPLVDHLSGEWENKGKIFNKRLSSTPTAHLSGFIYRLIILSHLHRAEVYLMDSFSPVKHL